VPQTQRPEKDMSSVPGPIIIGQACEFDYSDARACKPSDERAEVVSSNQQPATI